MADDKSMKIIPYTWPSDILQKMEEQKLLDEKKKLQTVKPHKSHVGLYDAKTPINVMPSMNSWEAIDVNGKSYPHKENEKGVPYFLARENPEEDKTIPQAIRKPKKVYQAPIDVEKADPKVAATFNPNGLNPDRLAAIEELANAKKGKPAPKAKPIRKMEPVEITDTPLYEDEPLVTDDRELVFDFGPMPEFDETTARSQLENAAARDHWYKMQKLNRGADLQYFDDMKKYRDMVDGFENELKSTKDKRPTGLDVANLKMALAYGDQISGTDLARHYTPPTALKDWQDRVDSLEQIVAAKRGEIPQEARQYIDMRENNKIAREGQEGMNIRQQRGFDHENQLFDKDAALKMWLAKNKPPSINPFSRLNYDLRASEALDNRVKDFSKDTRDVSDSLKSINGAIGMMDHFLKNDIPLTKAGNSGLGRFLSGSDGDGKALMLTPEGIELNSRIVDIVARYNKMISGAAVTDAEARRLLQVVAAGKFNDFNDMRKGLNYLQRKVKEEWKHVESAYRPEIISEYKRRGGSSYRDFNDNSSPLFTENDEVKKPQNPKDYKIGQVVRGHVFKGGDATNKNNWEKVK